MHGVYCGHITGLVGETALLKDVPGSDNVYAQFDNFDAYRNDVCLAFKWHLFKKSDFDTHKPEEAELVIPPWIQSALGMNKR